MKNGPDLVDRQRREPARNVAPCHVENPGQQRSAELRDAGVERVRQRHLGNGRPVDRTKERVLFRRDEGVRENFGESRPGQHLSHATPSGLRSGQPPAGRSDRNRRRNSVVAVNARDLLSETGCIDQVGSPRGRRDGPAVFRFVHRCANIRQHRFDFTVGVVDADQSSDEVDGQVNRWLWLDMDEVGAECVGRSAAQFDEQVHHPLRGGTGNERVHPAGETLGRFARQFVPAGGPGDRDGVERRGLDQNIGRRVVDFRRGTAHDAGQTDRTGFVGDEKVFLGQCSHLLVQGGQLFALRRATNRDATV